MEGQAAGNRGGGRDSRQTGLRREKNLGHLRVPTADELRLCAARDHIQLTPDEADALVPCVGQYLQMLDEVEELPEFAPETKYPTRYVGRVPRPEEDPFNSFTRLCRVEGAESGPLHGKEVAVKDNIAVAGIPITNGSRTFSYVPLGDAVVVERILDAGGTIIGKLNLDAFAMSGFAETSFFGPTRNPHRPTHSAGGSSGGAGAALASGAIDLALGVDQGGSARIPAALCGCVAIKPTYGLVPTFGMEYVDPTLDSICPMAMNVADAAGLLSVVAGEDWRGPQRVRTTGDREAYVSAAEGSARGLRIGIISEALDASISDEEVIEGVGEVRRALVDAGAEVEEISVPIWRHAHSIAVGVVLGGMPAMIRSDGMGYGHLGYVDTARVHATALWRRQEANLLPPVFKAILVTNTYVEQHYFNVVFAKAHNQRLALRRTLVDIFSTYDILITPTTPHTAQQLPTGRISESESITRAFSQSPFTAPLNISGHPAIAMPSGLSKEGLPISVQLIGRYFDENRLIGVASVLERALDVVSRLDVYARGLKGFPSIHPGAISGLSSGRRSDTTG
jgi:amidase